MGFNFQEFSGDAAPAEAPPQEAAGGFDFGSVSKPQFAEGDSATSGAYVGGAEVPSNDSNFVRDLLKQTSGVDYEQGIPDAGFRAGFSRSDNDKERASYLNEQIGKGGWYIDKNGEYIVKKEMLSKFGIQADYDRPVDEASLSMHDIADFAGDAPEIIGAIGGSVAATGAGLPAGLAMAAGGAALGKAVDEAVESLQGRQEQSLEEVAVDVGKAGLGGLAGEGVGRMLMATGRLALAPMKHAMTPEKEALAKEAADLGVSLSPSQVTQGKLTTRLQGMLDQMFGSEAAQKNGAAFLKEMDRLKGGVADRGTAGTALIDDIVSSRKALSDKYKALYAEVDEMTGGSPFIPTMKLKESAQAIYDDTLDAAGNVIPAMKEQANAAAKFLNLPDKVTVSQMNSLKEGLDMASDSLTPTIGNRTAAILNKGLKNSYEDVANYAEKDTVAQSLLVKVRESYAKDIAVFDDAVARKIVKDPKKGLTMEPSKVIDVIMRKRSPDVARRMMAFASPDSKRMLRSVAVDEILSKYMTPTGDPLAMMFNGVALKKSLESYGDETLTAILGADTVKSLHRLSDVTRTATNTMGASGGLVVAAKMLAPLSNLGFLAKMRVLNRLMRTPKMLKWLTVGLQAPKTRAGSAALTRLSTMLTTLSKADTATNKPTGEQ